MRALALVLFTTSALAEPRVASTRTDEKLTLDGKLDEPAWSTAPVTNAFTQKFPDERKAPVDETRVRILYDREAIWIGFECAQSVPVTARLTRRDRTIEADWVEVDLDTRGDGVSGFQFMVNAAGVLYDGLRFNDTDYSPEWDENWDARVTKNKSGWTAELRIPLRILRFDKLAKQDWGLELRRYVSLRGETDEWAYIPRNASGEVSHYGRLTGLEIRPRGNHFELRPFGLAYVRHRDAASSMVTAGWDAGGSAGLDLKWHITPNLTLDATFNPDFAQVEADQVILNLTTTEIFFPEKRPFFLEGLDAFNTVLPVLYTRRIGLAPAIPYLRQDPPFGERLVDVPTASTIYGAAKLVGKLGRRWTLAVLSALTGRNSIDTQLADGHRQSFTAEPMSLFNVLRLKWDVADNAHVGFMGTAVNRFEDGRYPIVPANGATPTYALCPDNSQVSVGARCTHDAYLASLDFRWRSKSGEWLAMGQAMLSAIDNGPGRTMLDGTVIGPGDLGGAGLLWFSREGGKHWLFNVQYDAASLKFDRNDLGYVTRQNSHHIFLQGSYRTTEPWKSTLETRTNLEYYDRYTLTGLNTDRGVNLNTTGRSKGLWGWWLELHFRHSRFDDREVGDGTALERDALVGAEIYFNTDSRKRVYFELDNLIDLLFDGFHLVGNLRLVVRALPQLDFELTPFTEYTTGEPRYAGPSGTTPIFGLLDALAVGTTLRATYTFTPRLSLSLYTQLFLASKHFTDFSTAAGRVLHLSDLHATSLLPDTNPDLEEAALNVNLVLRWEYRLGSTLFFVYSRTQTPDLTLLPGQEGRLDIGAIRKAPAADVLLLKLTYWWG